MEGGKKDKRQTNNKNDIDVVKRLPPPSYWFEFGFHFELLWMYIRICWISFFSGWNRPGEFTEFISTRPADPFFFLVLYLVSPVRISKIERLAEIMSLTSTTGRRRTISPVVRIMKLPSYKTNLQVESYSILGWCFPADRLFPIHLWFSSQFVPSPIDFRVAPREFWIRIACIANAIGADGSHSRKKPIEKKK